MSDVMRSPEVSLRILFVCTGNTCRSPMAVALAACLPAADVSSAGTCADDGSPAADFARAEMRRRDAEATEGFDSGGPLSTAIERHRSRTLNADMACDADIVVCMEQWHADAVGEPSNGADVRVWDVPDPVGGSPEAYRACADTLAALVDDLARELEGRR